MTTDSNISLIINGERLDLTVPKDRSLLDALRENLDLTGAKKACDDGECGSCFVLLGDKPVMSCKLDATRAQGKEIVTIEGLAGNATGALHPLQEERADHGIAELVIRCHDS